MVEVDEGVRLVRTTDVDLERRESDPGILVLEEDGEDIEDGESRVDHVLEAVEGGRAIDRSSLSVDSLGDRGGEDLLELDESFVERGELAVDEDLTRLEGDLRRRLGVELGEVFEDDAERRFDDGERVGLLDELEEGEDEGVLRRRLVVRQNELDDDVEVLPVRVSQLEDDVVLPATEHPLRLVVDGHDVGEGGPLVQLEARLVALDDVVERREGSLERRALRRAEVVEGRVDELAQAGRGELGRAVGVRVVDRRAEARLEAGRETSGERRENRVRLTVRQLGVPQNGDELLDGCLHDRLVVVTSEDVGEDLLEVDEALVGLVTDDGGETEGGELAVERLGVVDARGVVEGEDTEDVAGFEGDSWLLDELGDSVLRRDERHDHLQRHRQRQVRHRRGRSDSPS